MDMRFVKVTYDQFKKDFMEINQIDESKSESIDTKLREIYDGIKIPRRKTSGAAGYDFSAPYSFTLNKKESIVIPTGIRWVTDLGEDEPMPNLVLCMVPRSGSGTKYGVKLCNTLGIIDNDYQLAKNTGHILLKITNDGSGDSLCGVNIFDGNNVNTVTLSCKTITNPVFSVEAGDGIAQGIIFEFHTISNEIKPTESRNGGFGSTDAEKAK